MSTPKKKTIAKKATKKKVAKKTARFAVPPNTTKVSFVVEFKHSTEEDLNERIDQFVHDVNRTQDSLVGYRVLIAVKADTSGQASSPVAGDEEENQNTELIVRMAKSFGGPEVFESDDDELEVIVSEPGDDVDIEDGAVVSTEDDDEPLFDDDDGDEW